MKKLCSLLFLNVLLISVTYTCAEILYREATPSDVSGILKLYEGMKDEDKKNLVIFPTPHMQKEAILKNIKNKRIVVAVNDNTIIGFAKNYIINDSKELDEILQDELNIVKNETTLPQPCLVYKTYSLSKNMHCFKQFPEPIKQNENDLKVLSSSLKQKESSIFIYTGAYYTHPDYRGKGINTQLCLYQLKTLFETIKKIVLDKKITHIALLYGQVLANTKHKGMVREFAHCLQAAGTSAFTLHHYLFKATKPEFKEINGEFQMVFLPENEGRGSIVIFEVDKNNYEDLNVLF